MNKKQVEMGFTNKVKFIDDEKFVIKKTYTKFNHKIDYKTLKQFDFVPKLLNDSPEEQEWELIEGDVSKNFTNEDLKQIAANIRTLHKSEIKFPKNNLKDRSKEYLKIVHDKGIVNTIVDKKWLEMNRLLNRMNNINPCHNDIWWQNLIKNKEGKFFLVDWEYATMGDKHFDLAYFIESSYLSNEQEKVFLDAYNSFDDYQAYIPEWLPKYKQLVLWITILWAQSQDKLPFDISPLIKNLEQGFRK